jgi:hypothetical protein
MCERLYSVSAQTVRNFTYFFTCYFILRYYVLHKNVEWLLVGIFYVDCRVELALNIVV